MMAGGWMMPTVPERADDRRRELRALIAHRRCLVCGEMGAEHRITLGYDGSAMVLGGEREDTHLYDPGERRLGLGAGS